MKYALLLVAFMAVFGAYSQNGGESCATATVIDQLPYIGIGNISEAINDYPLSCQGDTLDTPDIVYQYSTGTKALYLDMNFCLDTTDFVYQVSVYENDCSDTPIICEYGYCGFFNLSQAFNKTITAESLQANTTYYIVINAVGYSVETKGNYQVAVVENVSRNPPDSTILPLVIIDTDEQEIVDEPKITAQMKIINHKSGLMNRLTDPPNIYDGFVGIEIRGSSSSNFPQKPFGFETRDALGDNNNVSLLGMPEENDWILISNYNDKVFFRNILSLDLFRKMGHYAPRTQLCEVVINDAYNGIYVLTEKIKRDKNRVDISTLNEDENTGDDLTGGYIFKVDYWGFNNSWSSDYKNPNIRSGNVRFVYNYPDAQDITEEQKTYIQGSVSMFEDALWGANFRDPEEGYRQYIDVTSFIDYFIVNEFARNNDGFKKSRNFYKDKESIDPLIYAGPVWDFDWAYKDITETPSFLNGAGWQHSRGGNPDVTPPGWYIRMMQDTLFSEELTDRYFELRSSVLDETRLFAYIDSLVEVVSTAQQRHYTRWPTLGVAVGTDEFGDQPTTYAEEVTKFKGWIAERLVWLDANMPPKADPLPVVLGGVSGDPLLEVYPNPSKNYLNISITNRLLIEEVNVYHISGQLMDSYMDLSEPQLTINTTNFSGIYILKIVLNDGSILGSRFLSH